MAIRVIIAAPRAVGKSTVGEIIREALAAKGYEIERFEDTDPAKVPPPRMGQVQIVETNAHR